MVGAALRNNECDAGNERVLFIHKAVSCYSDEKEHSHVRLCHVFINKAGLVIVILKKL